MLEIQKTEDFNETGIVVATMLAEDIIKMIVANPSSNPREGFICMNVIPTVCAKVTKRARSTPVFEYGMDNLDSAVSETIMSWVGTNLISKRSTIFKQVSTIDDVVFSYKNQFTKKFSEQWLDNQFEIGEQVVTTRKKNPGAYTDRHLSRIGILEGIKNGKNLPLTIKVRVFTRDERF